MISFLFYFFSILAVISAVRVITVANPVYSVLFLILTFFLSSTLFIMLGAELMAMLIVIVYVGAVAVLFLFVVMMLDIDYVRFRQGFIKYFIVGILCASMFFYGIVEIVSHSKKVNVNVSSVSKSDNIKVSNIVAIGNVLYTRYMYVFHLSGVLLLIAIIGAMVLTLRHRLDVRRQSVKEQIMCSSSIKKVDVKVGEGVEWKS